MNNERVIFYRCNVCGNVFEVINNSGMLPVCCGKQMEKLIPNSTDGITEKHIPFVTMEKNVCHVQVGEEEHPMESNHWIMWVYIETKNGGELKRLYPKENAKVSFSLNQDTVIAVYAYCNKHGLWVKEMK